MKVLIVSDTHKSHRNLEKIIEREQPCLLYTSIQRSEENHRRRKRAGSGNSGRDRSRDEGMGDRKGSHPLYALVPVSYTHLVMLRCDTLHDRSKAHVGVDNIGKPEYDKRQKQEK